MKIPTYFQTILVKLYFNVMDEELDGFEPEDIEILYNVIPS